jgi:hypothetical protein
VEKALTDKLMNKIAFTIALDGKAGITQLRTAAIMARRTGYPDAADAILEIVKAAEAALTADRLSATGTR